MTYKDIFAVTQRLLTCCKKIVSPTTTRKRKAAAVAPLPPPAAEKKRQVISAPDNSREEPLGNRRKCVRFNDAGTYVVVPSRADMTSDEKRDVWWSKADLYRIMRNNCKIVKKSASSRETVALNEYCRRIQILAETIADDDASFERAAKKMSITTPARWCHSSRARGLERCTLEILVHYDLKRQQRRKERMLAGGPALAEVFLVGTEEYRTQSRASAMFARMLGAGDAFACSLSSQT